MIVSHSHKFIFLKPHKVAGTSVEVALARNCLEGDIITPIGNFDPRWDEDPYEHPGRKWPGLRRHATIREIRKVVGEEVWEDYLTVSVVRNPWDLVVSQYHWATRNLSLPETLAHLFLRPKRFRKTSVRLGFSIARKFIRFEEGAFPFYARYLHRLAAPNAPYYFNGKGKVEVDRVLRFERLANDFAHLCKELGMPPTPLPSLKTKSRPRGPHYSSYYDEETRALVAQSYRREIEAFGYTFETPE